MQEKDMVLREEGKTNQRGREIIEIYRQSEN